VTLKPTTTALTHRYLVLVVLCVTLLLTSLDNTVLNVALPSIVRDLGASAGQLQWIVDAYAVTFAGLLLVMGSLGDRLGRKWVFEAGLVVFAVGSLGAAFSPTTQWLTFSRAVMGVGAAALMPCTLSILTNVFTAPHDRAKAIGIWSATAGIGVAIGPIIGGLLLSNYWWGSVFLVNVPIASIGLVAAAIWVPNSKDKTPHATDIPGALLATSGFALLLWGIIAAPTRSWSDPIVVVSLLAAAALLVGFVIYERHSPDPMLPMHFFSDRRYSAAIGALALTLFALLGMFFLLTQYLQFALGYSPLATGVRIAPLAAVILIAAPASVWLVHKLGTKSVVSFGLLLIAIGLGLLSRTTIHTTYAQCLPWFILIGTGVGLALAPSTESVMGSVPTARAGVGSATSDSAMQVGGALGVAILGTVLAMGYKAMLSPLLASYHAPTAVKSVILSSLGGANAVAAHLPSQAHAKLVNSATRAFINGMDQGLLIACIVVAVAGAVVLIALPGRARLAHQANNPQVSES
jgi:EmrB/QacA subfamily drug resistance transporter